MHLSQRGHLNGVIDDKGRLDERTLAELAEDFVNQFALTHGVVDFKFQLLAHLADFLLGLAFQIKAGLLLDGLENRQTTIRSLEADDLTVNLGLGLAVDSDTDCFQQLLGERHHPIIVLVLHIQLHAGEFGIMVTVHTLVAEVLTDLIDALEATHNQTLEVKLGSNAHIHGNVQRIEVRDERASGCTTGDGLQGRCLDLSIACIIKHLAHGLHHQCTLQESILHTSIDN